MLNQDLLNQNLLNQNSLNHALLNHALFSQDLNASAVMRFGVWRNGGFFELIILLAVGGVLVWVLTRPRENDSARNGSDAGRN